MWCVEFKLPAKHNSAKKLKARNVMAYSGSVRDWAALALVWHVTFYARRRKSNKFGGKYFRPCWLLLLVYRCVCVWLRLSKTGRMAEPREGTSQSTDNRLCERGPFVCMCWMFFRFFFDYLFVMILTNQNYCHY